MKVVKPLALIALIAGISCGTPAAHADGVSTKITNGQPVTGAVTGKGSDTYSFNVAKGTSFLVTIAETGVHNDGFLPVIDLNGPDGHHEHMGFQLGETVAEVHPVAGPWTVTVSSGNGLGNVGGGYQPDAHAAALQDQPHPDYQCDHRH